MRLEACVACLCLCLAAGAALAQLTPVDPDWKESDAPPPPALRLEGLIELEVQRSSLKFAVDPASISVGSDGVVRYVVVVRGENNVSAVYEGIRCNTADFKVYARYNAPGGWVATRQIEWKPLTQNSSARHSLVLAQSGVCTGNSPNRSQAQIVRDLNAPTHLRFN